MLALLMAGTSWAIAECASIWLVPPYLLLMAWLLFPSTSRASGSADQLEQGTSDSPQPSQAVEASDRSEALRDDPASAGSVVDGLEPAGTSSPTKPRRGKGRSKKAKPPVVELPEATWIQVAPGKFVRVEVSEASNPAGPHGSPSGPVESDAPPPLSDREESDERQNDEPTRLVESGSSPLAEESVEAGSAGSFEGPSAVDGNAPQAEGSIEATDSGWLEPSTAASDDQAEAEPSALLAEDADEPSTMSEAFEPAGSPPLTDVRIEEPNEWGEPLAEADPTETPVDEADFDDAGPSSEDLTHELNASTVDTDESETEPTTGSSTGSHRWPERLARRVMNRGGHPSRTLGRTPTSRRPVRSSGPTRRPTSSRRQGRREPGRPRRITRAFPPRSPPFGSSRWSVVSGQWSGNSG
jgi:hypothetical protein